jgi:pSer/pThr/pTyr-binding forkhead associated (FHA) protein
MAAIRVTVRGGEIDRKVLGKSLVIGRGEECDLRLSDGDVSRAHCRIEHAAGGYILVDLGSRNGTLLDGQRITRRLLCDGDALRVGSHTLLFESGVAAPRTLDDEVLEMLNQVAPSPSDELEAVGAAIRGPDALPAEGEFAGGAVAAVELQAPPKPVERKTPTAPARSLWDAAISVPAAKTITTGRPTQISSRNATKSHATVAAAAPWFRRRIPLPATIAAAAIATLVVYLLAWGLPNNGPRIDPNRPLQHAKHARSAD